MRADPGTRPTGEGTAGTRAGSRAAGLGSRVGSVERGGGDADVAAAAKLFAEPSRARVLLALADGRSLPASVLASEAGVSASAISAHLTRLLAAGLVDVEPSGRHRYCRLRDQRVAAAVEALAALGPTRPVASLRAHGRAAALREARTCYDHLAGRLGATVTAGLIHRGALAATDGIPDNRRRPHDPLSRRLPHHPYELGSAAAEELTGIGVNLEALLHDHSSARPLLSFCLDWSEQRHHLAGRLGAAVLTALLEQGRLQRGRRPRTLELTDDGHEYLAHLLAPG